MLEDVYYYKYYVCRAIVNLDKNAKLLEIC